MSNEDPNNSFHWRNKLEELEHIQGGSFNKNSAWDKLHDRMQGKKSNRKISWYWAVAACLFFALLITLMNYYHRSSPPAQPATVEKKAAAINTVVSIAAKNKKTDTINTASLVKNKMVITSKKSNYPDHKNIRAGIISNTQLNDVPAIRLDTEPFTKTLEVPGNPSIVDISLPEKKKLKVVHINELGDPVVESRDVVHKTNNHSVILKLGNEEVYAGSPVVHRSSELTLLKAKL